MKQKKFPLLVKIKRSFTSSKQRQKKEEQKKRKETSSAIPSSYS
jgi:hypothetical protein